MLLLNNDNILGKGYVPNLEIPNIRLLNKATDEERHLSHIAISHIEELFKVAKSEGINL